MAKQAWSRHKPIREAMAKLKAAGVRWSMVDKAKHVQFFIETECVLVMSHGGAATGGWNGRLDSAIRRHKEKECQ